MSEIDKNICRKKQGHWKTDYRGPLAIHAAQRLIDPPEKLS